MTTVNIATHLQEMARRQPEQSAVMLPVGRAVQGKSSYTTLTYHQLDWMSDRLAEEFVKLGVGPGVRTVLMVPPSLEFFALTFALFKAGAVSVFVDPGMGVKNIGKCLAEAQPEAFVGIPKAHFARWLIGWGKPTLKQNIAVGPGAGWCRLLGHITTWDVPGFLPPGHMTESSEFSIAATTAADTAAILFTSGSTGVPKGAVYSHGNFAAQIEMLRTAFSIQPGEIDLCTFPLFALFAPALGMTAVVPRMDFTRPATVHPPEIADPIQQHGVANLFGSPALLNRVGRYYERENVQWPSIRRILSAGAPVSAEIIERFARHLAPGVQIYTPYGATESLPVAVIGSDEILTDTRHVTAQGGGTCVGRPVEGIQVSIIRISDDPIENWDDSLVLSPGEIGEIVVHGLNVTQEYFHRPDLTALAKIADAKAGRSRHRMGDVGYLDSKGRLWFCGRKSHRVITADRTHFTEPVEGVFNTHPAVFRTALVGVRRSGGIEPVLCVERESAHRRDPTESLTRELKELGARFEQTRPIQTFLYHDAFPVDIRHNSKIFREKLAVWAEEQMKT
ncbi:MAG: AMP-binding protein [Planctomycetes bacterium]|nr:AMP-binding protein [Planctomycetota bacterium]